MRLCEIEICLEVEVFLYSLLVSKLQNFSKEKKKMSFLYNFAFVDPNLLSLEGPNHEKKCVLLGVVFQSVNK